MNVLMKVKDMYDESDDVLMKVTEENEKVGLKLNIQKTKIMASGPITSWEIDGETMGRVRDFILGGSEIIADGDGSGQKTAMKLKDSCSLEGKLWLTSKAYAY